MALRLRTEAAHQSYALAQTCSRMSLSQNYNINACNLCTLLTPAYQSSPACSADSLRGKTMNDVGDTTRTQQANFATLMPTLRKRADSPTRPGDGLLELFLRSSIPSTRNKYSPQSPIRTGRPLFVVDLRPPEVDDWSWHSAGLRWDLSTVELH